MRKEAESHIGPARAIIFKSGLLILLIALASPAMVTAQEEEKKADNTGTNPINFTYDARFYTETSWLPIDDSSLISNTLELRMPLGRITSRSRFPAVGS